MRLNILLAFTAVCAGVLILRYTMPETPRPFRVPFAPLVCTAGVLMCLGLTFFLIGRLFSNLGVLNDWPALFSAAFPLAVFVAITVSMLWWLERR